MFKEHPIKKYLPYSLAAAIVYSIAACIYINRANYTDIWILYVGNALFAAVILLLAYFLYRHYINTRSVSKMVIGLHISSVIAIILSCLVCLIAFAILDPGVYSPNPSTSDALADSPPMMAGKNNGLMFVLFINAVVGNAATGFFISLLFPFSLVRNQKGNKEGENQGPGKPVQAQPGTEVDSLDQPVRNERDART